MPDHSRRSSRGRRPRSIIGLVVPVAIVAIVLWTIWANLGPGDLSPEKAPSQSTTTSQQIEISDSAWQHVLDRHTAGGSMTAGKSVFNAGVDIRALIKNAEQVTPVTEPNGRLKRVVDAGRSIGIDRATGRQTSTYTVITTESGDLVTAFPGLP